MCDKPNFLIVGAAKAGTTSLAKYLNQHPDIFIPEKKELRFFVADILRNISPKDPLKRQLLKQSVLDSSEYFNLFKNRPERRRGEASVHYLYHYDSAIPNIKQSLGDIPIIILLREPVSRAISNWDYNGDDIESFEAAIALEPRRKAINFNSFWYYRELSLYSKQVAAYLNNFTNVKVLLFEDFIENTDVIMADIFNFLNLVNPIGQSYTEVHNKYKKLIPNNDYFRKFFSNRLIRRYVLYLYKKNVLPKNSLVRKKNNIDESFIKIFKQDFLLDRKELQDLLPHYSLDKYWT